MRNAKGFTLIELLIVIAIMGKKLEHHTVIVPKKKAKVTKKAVSTGAGSIQMVSG